MGKESPTVEQAALQGAVVPDPGRRTLLPLLAATMAALATAKASAQAKQTVSNADTGTIWWSELRTRDSARARSFYAGAIGWTPKTVAQDNPTRPPAPGEKAYTLFLARGQEAAGVEEVEQGDTSTRPGWFTYVQVDDVDETVKKVVALGGKVVQEPIDVAAVGRMAEIEDPEGNRLGLVSPRA